MRLSVDSLEKRRHIALSLAANYPRARARMAE
jgi:hypothetical protein